MNLFNKRFIRSNKLRNKFYSENESYDNLLENLIYDDLIERIDSFDKDFDNILEINIKSNKIINKFSNSRLSITNGLDCNIEDIYFEDDNFDLIVNILDFHYINDIRPFLLKIKNMLSDNGRIIAAFFTTSTLIELRDSIINSQIKLDIPVTPHIIPFISMEDMTKIMSILKFRDIVIDNYFINLEYDSVISLMHDLRKMGQANAMNNRRYLQKTILKIIESIYRNKYTTNDNMIKASFNIATITAIK
jgi:SAM-dependent methyltransferase